MTKAFDLTPRQALIAAAVTGWAGDGPCGWSSPVEKSTLLAWGQSYLRGNDASPDLELALQELVAELCFIDVQYPIFKEPIFYCAYNTKFLDELPDPISDYIATDRGQEPDTRESLSDFWEDMENRHSEEAGGAWIYWGMCNGQGSQGPSSDAMGPCLGPSCCCYKKVAATQCNWGLEFRSDRPASLPDMRALFEKDPDEQERLVESVLCQMGYGDPSPGNGKK